MLATSLFCHINELALSLGQHNEQDSVKELDQLTGICGQDAHIYLFRCLASKVDVTGQSSLDPLQQKLLQRELKRVTTEPNFVSIFCQALVPLLTSYRSENHTENFLARFCTSLAPEKPQLIALALALVECDDSYVQSEAEQFLKALLLQEWGSGTKGQLLPHRTFVALLLHLSTSPVFAQTDSSGIVEALLEAHTDFIAGEFKQEEIGVGGIAQLNNLHYCAAIEKALGGGSRKFLASGMVNIADSIGSSGNLAGFLADLGPAVTDNATVLRQAVEESGIVVDEEQIAQLLGMLVASVGNTSTTTSNPEEKYDDNSGGDSSLSTALTSSLLASGGSGGGDLQGEEGGTSWNIGIVKQYLASDYEEKVDWVAVVRHLDFPGFHIPDEKSLALLLELYRGASHSNLPIDIICGPWRNTRGQLSLLSTLVEAPPELFSFNVSQNRVPLLESMDTHVITPNEAWLCLELLEALLKAASSDPELYTTVKGLLSNPMSQCPELLVAGLVSIPRDSEALKGPGGRLRLELLSRLLPPFFRPNRSAATPALVRSLFLSNPALVVQSCVDAYSADASLPSLLGIARVVRLVPEARPLILRHSKHSFAIAMASILFGLQVAGTPPERRLDLEVWAKERLGAPDGDVFQQRLTTFVNRHMREAASRASSQKGLPNPVEGAEVMVTCLMTLEAMATFLRAVAASSSEDQVPHLMHLLELAKQLQPALLPMLQQQVPLAAASSQTPVAGSPGSGSDPTSLTAGGGGSRAADSEVEDAANTIFTQLYSSEKTVQEVVDRLEHLRASGDSHEQCVFACVVHSLFDESHYFYKYPEAELQVTSVLFGQIIRQLVSGTTLVIALRYVLEALLSRPGPGSSGKMFRFGMIALKQFKSRLSEWPQYCSHIVHIPHIVSDYADVAADVEAAMRSGMQFTQSGGGGHVGNSGDVEDATLSSLLPQPSQKQPQPPQQPEQSSMTTLSMPSVPNTSSSPPALTAPDIDAIMMDHSHGMDKLMTPPENVMDRIHFIINNLSQKNLDKKIGEMRQQMHGHPEYSTWISRYLVVKRVSSQPNFHSIYLQFIDRLDEDVTGLMAAILQCTYHNIGQLLRSRNIITSTRDRSLLKNLGSWLGQITLARNKPILQRQLDLKELLFQGYETGCLIAVTPFVAKILEGAQHSTVFLPPNPWIMALLSALHDMYDLEDLKMNIKFEIEMLVKILDLRLEDVPKFGRLSSRKAPQKEKNSDFNVKDKQSTTSANSPASRMLSPVRRPPTTASSSIGGPAIHLKGGELHSQHQFTPANSSATVGTGGASASHHQQPSPTLLPRGMIQIPESALQAPDLSTTAMPQAIGGNLMPPAVVGNSPLQPTASPHLQAGTSTSSAEAAPSPAALPEQPTVIPNLAAYMTISSTLQIFITQPGLKQLVPVAVDCAIREIIQPVVERSVTIACITTRELIMKDFAVEPDESKMLKAAHLMITSLAGSLALVTCKEPLRMSIGTHLRQLLNTHAPEWAGQAMDAVIISCSSDNLELGCMLIEKAATEKAVRDIDELIASAVSSRRKQLQDSAAVTGQQNFYDPTSRTFKTPQQQQLQYPSMLPKLLRSRPEGLTPPQLMVYEAFQHMARASSTMSSRQQQTSSSATTSAYDQSPPQQQQQQQQQGELTVSEALAAWQVAMHHLDIALQQLLMQAAASGRPGELSLGMVGIDTELSSALHEVMGISQKVPANLREGALLKFSQSVFRTLFKNTETESAVEVPLLHVEVYVAILELCLRDLRQVLKDEVVTAWYTSRLVGPMVGEGERKLQKAALTMLIRAKMIRLPELDHHIASNMANPPSSPSVTPERAAISWAEFGLSLIRQCVFDHTTQVAVGPSPKAVINKFTHTLDQLSRVAQLHAGITRQFDKLMIDLQEVGQASGGDVLGGPPLSRPQQAGPAPAGSDSSLPSGPPSVPSIPPASSMPLSDGSPAVLAASSAADTQRGKQAVTSLLEYWIHICQERSHDGKALSQYIQLLQQQGVVATDESTECFLRIATDLVIEACLKSASSNSTSQDKEMDSVGGFDNLGGNATLSYSIIDAYSSLLVLLMKGSPEPAAIVRVSVLNKVLGTLARCLLVDYEAKHATKTFDQRPHYRLLVNLVHDLCGLEQQLPETTQLQVLGGLASAFHMLQPSVVPGFTFAWLGLISHRLFMPTLLQANLHKGWPFMRQLLVDLFAYAEPLLSFSKLSTPGLKFLYKSILRMMVVLLHDFPEFLCEYHLIFCTILPSNCIQLRNLVLSALPRNVYLPDLFTTNLKADLLVEISQPPRILSNYAATLNHLNIRGALDKYIMTGMPQQFLEELPAMLRDEAGTGGRSKYNVMAINALVVYVGSQAILQRQSKSQKILQNTPMDVFQSLACALDMEGRYIFLNSIANQLRYPNNHTHYFSSILLYLFEEATMDVVQEQITRILLERLIVHRPHPWGLLITFIELIKNPKYNFWKHKFTKLAPELEKLFVSVARNCMAGGVTGDGGDVANSAAVC